MGLKPCDFELELNNCTEKELAEREAASQNENSGHENSGHADDSMQDMLLYTLPVRNFDRRRDTRNAVTV